MFCRLKIGTVQVKIYICLLDTLISLIVFISLLGPRPLIILMARAINKLFNQSHEV